MVAGRKVLALGILLIITGGMINRDRAISLEKSSKKQIVQKSNVQAQTNTMPIDSTQLSKTVTSKNKFALNLLQEITQQNPEANILISPFSVGAALSMLYNGATDTTQQELASLLEITDSNLAEINQDNQTLTKTLENSDDKVNIAIANSLWVKAGFPLQQSFIDANQQYYDANIQELDFDRPQAKDVINKWVAENTQNKITNIIEQISPEQALFLINAIYFKGQWQNNFNPEATKEQDFYLSNGQVKKHPLMFKFGEYQYYENPDFQVINLPYGSGRIGMNIFLPQKDSNLTTFFAQLNQENLNNWLEQMSLKEGKIQIPRFKQEYEINLNNTLKELGAASMFNPAQANFANLSEESVAVAQIKHKAVIEVNEEGTEAAAVTSIEMLATSVSIPFDMIINRPFFYTIQDSETGTILFMGIVQNPES